MTLHTLQLEVRAQIAALPQCGVPSFILGCSGGADSTALAFLLKKLSVPCILAHLNHALRETADADAAAVQQLAVDLDLPCIVERVDVQQAALKARCGLEEAGRNARYAFFERVRQAQGYTWIALAHHADDLAEDMLLRFIRGAGWPALGGMRAVDTKRRIVRPLLHVPRAHIVQALVADNVPWRDDPTNTSDAFLRNRLRAHVLPLLLAENPSLHRSVKHLWALAREDEAYWNTLLEPVLEKAVCHDGETQLAEHEIRQLPRAARLRLYHRLIQMTAMENGGQARAESLFQLDTALFRQQRPKLWQFSGGIEIELNHHALRVRHRKNTKQQKKTQHSELITKKV